MNNEITHTSVSLISTVFNEENSISRFLDSLMAQTRKPDEIVIVDGGSKDRTVEIIKDYMQRRMPIRLHEAPGANISKGRNIAIEKAKGEIIAATDAGCILDKNWLKYIVEPFERDSSIDVVSGFYYPLTNSFMEKCIAAHTTINLKYINPDTFRPSSRSISFKKKVWKKTNGYPEWLYTSEDTLFDIKLKRMGFHIYFAPKAFVYWNVRPTLRLLFKQYFIYGRGNGHTLLFWKLHLANYSFMLLWFLSIIVSLINSGIWFVSSILPLLAVAITFFVGLLRTGDLLIAIVSPLIQATIRIAQICGFPVGLYQRRKRKYALIQKKYMKIDD